MSNVDINVDGRTDGQKIGRLYRTLLQAGAIKIGLELLNGIIYNGALCLTSNSNRNQLINYV